jgi:hypothetical protein
MESIFKILGQLFMSILMVVVYFFVMINNLLSAIFQKPWKYLIRSIIRD